MKKITALLTAGLLVVAPLTVGFLNSNTKAATLSDVAIELSNPVPNSNTEIYITFTPVTPITNGTVLEINYDTAFTYFNGIPLTNADVAVTGTNITSSVESDFVAGYIKSTLTTSGSVTTPITIIIGNESTDKIYTPVTAGNYNFTISANIGGSGSSYDSGAGLAYVGYDNEVQLQARVAPIIDLEIYQQNSDTLLTNLSGSSNLCNLGVLSINAVNTCIYDVGFSTNNDSGVTIKMASNGLLISGGNDVNNVADGTVSAGVEEYGFRITDAGTGCSASASGSYGSQDSAVPVSATNVITSSAACNGTSSSQAAKRIEFTHKASIDGLTKVGTYTQTATFTAYTN